MELVSLRRMCFKYKTGIKHENRFVYRIYYRAYKNIVSIIRFSMHNYMNIYFQAISLSLFLMNNYFYAIKKIAFQVLHNDRALNKSLPQRM